MRDQAIAARTQIDFQAIALAVRVFHTNLNRWPTNLAELNANTSGQNYFGGNLNDAWGRPYLYDPPTASARGKIQTFGGDGNPGNKDGDVSLEF
jgi:type II secretory pathway pseudopilin PulG